MVDDDEVEVVLVVEGRERTSYSESLLDSEGQLKPSSSSSSTVAELWTCVGGTLLVAVVVAVVAAVVVVVVPVVLVAFVLVG